MTAEFLDIILEGVISYLVPILELIGVFIVAYGTIKSFIKFIRSGLNSDDTRVKIDLAETLALSLEFKMAGEILKTVVSHTIEELSILGAVIVLRALLTFLIHWELKWSARQNMLSANMQHFRKTQRKSNSKQPASKTKRAVVFNLS
jgi:uncharacterized membrane protein